VVSILKPTSMKNSTKNFLKLSSIVLSTTFILISCSASREEKANQEAYAKASADSVSSTTEQSSSQKEPISPNSPKKDSLRAFVRKADLYFKVKNVKTATFDIERIVNEHQGYVTTSDLQSTVNYKNDIRISNDSMREIKNYTVHSDITIRVPNDELNKTLSEIAVLIDYLDHRVVKADDVTKQLSAADLWQQRFANHQKRLEKAIDEKGKKLNTTVEAEDNLYAKQATTDDVKLNAQELKHDIAYSIVTISIYQKETTKSETYAYAAPIEPFQPNFGSQLLTALTDGGAVFGAILLFFIRLWPIALLILGGVAIFKFIYKRKWFVQ
jgi:hypothetical protein